MARKAQSKKRLSRSAFLDELERVISQENIGNRDKMQAMALFARCMKYDEAPPAESVDVPKDELEAARYWLDDIQRRLVGERGIAYTNLLKARDEMERRIREIEKERRADDADFLANLEPAERRAFLAKLAGELTDDLLIPFWEACKARGFE